MQTTLLVVCLILCGAPRQKSGDYAVEPNEALFFDYD
jgi:hypothetical protein